MSFACSCPLPPHYTGWIWWGIGATRRPAESDHTKQYSQLSQNFKALGAIVSDDNIFQHFINKVS
jgi:hypothetical protein